MKYDCPNLSNKTGFRTKAFFHTKVAASTECNNPNFQVDILRYLVKRSI